MQIIGRGKRRHGELGDEGEASRILSRRRFLAGVATTTAAIAGAGFPGSAYARDRLTTAGSPDRRLGPRYGKDGLPIGMVCGRFVGVDRGSILVDSQTPAGVISIALTGNTEVYAAGRRAVGDVSGCRPGDQVDVGTFIAADGSRVANYVNANTYSYWLELTSVGGGSFTGHEYMDYAGTDLGNVVTCLLTPFSTIVPAGETLSAGDYVFVGSFSQSPAPNRGAIWAVTVHKLTGETL